MKNRISLILGPLFFIIFQFYMPDGLKPEAWQFLGITLWIVIWWVTEIVPIGVTSLLPILLFPLFGVMDERTVASHYTKPVIFLFMGGFFLAQSLTKWNLHKRFAFHVINFFGTSSNGLLIGFMLSTAFLSMWISNTATSIMMATIGISVIHTLSETDDCNEIQANTFAKALMLCIAYSASIGGITTLIGTPPNLLFANFMQENLNQNISMGVWMIKASPFVILMMVLTFFIIRSSFPSISEIPVGKIRQNMKKEIRKFHDLNRPEWTVIIVFIVTALLWITRVPLTNNLGIKLTDSIIAIGASLVLFSIPVSISKKTFVLDWDTAVKIPWGILLMFGAGLSLATGFRETGLDTVLGDILISMANIPNWVIILLIVTFSIFLTELISNTAAAATLLPLIMVLSETLNIPFNQIAIPVTIVCSAAFMLPVATPPNAVVFSFKYLRVSEMVRIGFVLNILAIALILTLSSLNLM